ncbi:MAG: alpha/beta hydrolase [Prevotellaceae bacterium]|nr:alpha/beta hydrolase [Prevotellaceae bacterium]
MEIANPIYDVVFKYLMEDNKAARLLVSSIIGEEVVSLEPKPQEHTREKDKKEETVGIPNLTVYRLDFSAKIKLADESYKVVVIEMQKADLPTDIMRFRRYLGEQYIDSENRVTRGDEIDAMQIYAIYFLGKELGIYDAPVLSISHEVKDVTTGKIIPKASKFIEGLNHKSWIVQISCLKERRRNELEQLLSVFDQRNRTRNAHILNVQEKDFPEKFHPIIRRLKGAASDSGMKKQMKEEEEVFRYLRDVARIEMGKAFKEKEEEIKEKNEELKENKKTIEEKEKTIEEKDKTIEEKDVELERLKNELQKYKQKRLL